MTANRGHGVQAVGAKIAAFWVKLSRTLSQSLHTLCTIHEPNSGGYSTINNCNPKTRICAIWSTTEDGEDLFKSINDIFSHIFYDRLLLSYPPDTLWWMYDCDNQVVCQSDWDCAAPEKGAKWEMWPVKWKSNYRNVTYFLCQTYAEIRSTCYGTS